MIDIDIQELANLTAGDADVENFERLFTKLKEMKGNKRLQSNCTKKSNKVKRVVLRFQIKLLSYHTSREKYMQRR